MTLRIMQIVGPTAKVASTVLDLIILQGIQKLPSIIVLLYIRSK